MELDLCYCYKIIGAFKKMGTKAKASRPFFSFIDDQVFGSAAKTSTLIKDSPQFKKNGG